MAKETEERLIRALEFLKEPQGSTISTIVKAMNGAGPQVSLKKVVQTLRGCMENGILKVADGRVKLKQLHGLSDVPKEQKLSLEDRPKSGYMKPECQTKTSIKRMIRGWKTKDHRLMKNMTLKGCENPCEREREREAEGEEGGEGGEGGEEGGDEGEGGGETTDMGSCPKCPKCKKRKRKRKMRRSKPRTKPCGRCPRSRPKPKNKCIKKHRPKPRPKKPKNKCKKRGRRSKIQPYCRKKCHPA